MVPSPEGNTDFFNPVAGMVQGDTLALHLFMIWLGYLLQVAIEISKLEAPYTFLNRY